MEPRPSPSPTRVHADVTFSAGTLWVHICERCGERMEERQCKIACTNCGFFRDCSDPWSADHRLARAV